MPIIREGGSFVDSIINKLPVELHIPGYEFCGPGTKLQKRLARGDIGINQLDASCREHDIQYSLHKDLASRHLADEILQERAWERVKSKDASLGEKMAAWSVSNVMKVKRKLGMGFKNKKKRTGKKQLTFKGGYIKKIANAVKKNNGPLKDVAKTALAAAKHIIREIGGKRNLKIPRIIPVPKQGGILPFLIPLFAGLSAAGALAGGTSGIIKAVNSSKAAKKQLDENARHNQTMEAIALGRKGNALYLHPYKTGSALYLKPYKPKN